MPAPWTEFAEAIPRALGITLADVPTIEDEAYIRELLQLAIMDDLLGPAGGPEELIVDMSVRDRYLVGKLAPMENAERGEDLPPAERKDEEQPDDLVPKGLKPGLEPEKVSDGAGKRVWRGAGSHLQPIAGALQHGLHLLRRWSG
ncbi:hypothetical protein P4238_15815 [Pseudomonas aeruginosa]|nr:hypothetical protein [Pseudomonas aeruginosa]